VRWVSPSWKDVIGTPVDAIEGRPVASILVDQADSNPFAVAMESMKKDDSKSHHIRFRVRLGPDSALKPTSEELAIQREEQGFRQDEPAEDEGNEIISLEGQGIMVYERTSGGQSHVCNEFTVHTSNMLTRNRQCG
jgi:serine/threonine-protein kinase RIM15